MEHGGPTHKCERDRIRQQRGAKRKAQMRAIRKLVAGWKDGREAEASMVLIAAVLDERAPA